MTTTENPYCLDCLQPRTAAADRHCRATSTRTNRRYHYWSDDARTLSEVETDRLVAELVARHPGQHGAGLVTRVARAADVAVLWEDRTTFESRLEVEITDEQWARISIHLEDFDEWADAGGTWEGREDFVQWCLARARLRLVEDSDGEPRFVEDRDARAGFTPLEVHS